MIQCHTNDRFHQTIAPKLGGSIPHDDPLLMIIGPISIHSSLLVH